ncbi:hypothetical protein EMIHUDRAFT_357957 [Emiliania huxleyi CCMP1516]|uniref:MORN repeat protein n=2 Tax=Emiliania huxleyi TaxID=2903 RepID=A0A0D3IIS7_EMIH1|nr:hypothetical protein EMIHUDRAFT_357957 [Emiliania huxleyi CCMP1516]EOD11162.1 hypothetical protein EMIHUDRAFT_357957 [Emiliania huxleyi CCMP1516]|eukprot:XP_005763591.1 hypothetical protein EMIHUDRAFT_357957 [Emiliania huxleyi CCMP1516]
MGGLFTKIGKSAAGEYEGEWNAAGVREGRGVMRYVNGNVYDGEWKAGNPWGRGVLRYANGDVYDGEFKAGLREGRGVMRLADGTNGQGYEGEWKAGLPEGHGVMRLKNGNVYDGDVASGFFKVRKEGDGPVGEAVKWLADGRQAARLRGWKVVEEISLEEARRTAERLGLALPSPLPGAA